ncbi:MAG: sulfotransferase [Rhodothermales bacterium]
MTLDKPNFVIIGAQKAGTTSLYHYLDQHPDVFMSAIKEPRFFSHLAKLEAGIAHPGSEAVTSLEAYRHLFDNATAKAVGEASVAYLDIPGTAHCMKQYIPHAKLIVLLRNPADRAYSQYLMHVREGTEHDRFEDAIVKGRYLKGGFYHKKLVPFFHHYGSQAIGVYFYDDLCHDPQALVQHIFRFLEIDDTFAPDLTVRHNVGGKPKNEWIARLFSMRRLNAFIKRIAPFWLVRMGISFKQLNYSRAPMPPHVRNKLLEIYKEDILALEHLLNTDMSRWLALEKETTA